MECKGYMCPGCGTLPVNITEVRNVSLDVDTGTPGVLTAYVIDPVDSTSFSPPSPQNPSAAEALKGQNKRLGITGVCADG